MAPRPRTAGLFAISLAWAAIAATLPASGAQAQELPLTPLLGALRQGGLVIFLRHAETGNMAEANLDEDLARCATQRNLSARGRDDAQRIGKAIRTLGIPVGTVTTSPYCRAKDTAQLAFGRYVEDRNLAFAMRTDAETTQRLADALRALLAHRPAPGSNSILVSHSANLYEAAGIFPKPEGAAYVFQPLAEGRFEALGRILPEDWNTAVGQPPSVAGTDRPLAR